MLWDWEGARVGGVGWKGVVGSRVVMRGRVLGEVDN